MELPIVITLLLTMASPFINAAIQNVTWSPKTKNLVALAVSALIAILYLFLTGGIGDWSQLTVVVPAIYGLQQAIYQFFLKNIATKFEAITTPGSTVVAPTEVPAQVSVTNDHTIDALPDNHTVLPVTSTVKTAISEPEEIVREDVRG